MSKSVLDVLLEGPNTIKTIAQKSGLSESRVREIVKATDNVETRKDGAKAAEFWIEPSTADRCPECDAGPDEQELAGESGTFLGGCYTCQKCGTTYNAITKETLKIAPDKSSKKRTVLNPQYKIVAKTEAVAKAGGVLTYDRENRKWVITMPKQDPIRLTAKEFSEHTPETIVKLAN